MLVLGGEQLVPLMLGALLLQSSLAPLTAAMGDALPQAPATAAGLALGLAFALGVLPALLGAPPSLTIIGSGIAAMFFAWWGVSQNTGLPER